MQASYSDARPAGNVQSAWSAGGRGILVAPRPQQLNVVVKHKNTINRRQPMYFGVDYHPEHWVYPYAGTPDRPEARWERDAQLMVAAGVNVVRMGEF